MDPETSQRFIYTYEWPAKITGGMPQQAAAVTTHREPSTGPQVHHQGFQVRKTGAPYGPLVIGALVTAAAVAYTRLMR